MERDYHNINLRKSLREGSIYGGSKSMKDAWSCFGDHHKDHDYLLGFSWPPRSYTCSFCKREFRSAQALGGHMNVHRRDRARLRLQSPPSSSPPSTNFHGSSFLSPNPNPNPNPNFSSSSLMGSSPSSPTLTLIPPLCSPSPASPPSSLSASTGEEKPYLAESLSAKFKEHSSKNVNKHIKPSLASVEEVKGLTRHDSCKFLKKGNEIISLDLEIGLIHESKQDLDLELRLGLA